jgi:hypothetical protein
MTMKRYIIYFVDEDPAARRANVRDLTTLLDNADLKVIPQEPLRTLADYNALLADSSTAAFILDQKMRGSGVVSYNGTDLASHLRSIDGKMPIYILTGHANDVHEFSGSTHLVEYILGKEEIEDVASEKARTVKARILRHLEVFNDVRSSQEQRFHDLLVKSLRQALSPEEQNEMDKLEGETTAPLLAAERAKEKQLGENIDKLKALVQDGRFPQ